MSKSSTILFITTSDYGQSNVALATIHALLTRHSSFDVHVASWPELEPRLKILVDCINAEQPSNFHRGKAVTFHNLGLAEGLDKFLEKRKTRKRADVPHPPGLNGAKRIELLTTMSLSVWDPEDHLSLFDWSGELVTEIKPALVVIDPFLIPIHDMVRFRNQKYAILSPCSLVDGLVAQQPWLTRFWHYPA